MNESELGPGVLRDPPQQPPCRVPVPAPAFTRPVTLLWVTGPTSRTTNENAEGGNEDPKREHVTPRSPQWCHGGGQRGERKVVTTRSLARPFYPRRGLLSQWPSSLLLPWFLGAFRSERTLVHSSSPLEDLRRARDVQHSSSSTFTGSNPRTALRANPWASTTLPALQHVQKPSETGTFEPEGAANRFL